jgi:glycosyltransferase involved in cell wall biosynthesis
MITERTEKQTRLPNSRAHRDRVIVRHCLNAHPHMCKYLIQKHGVADLCRLPPESGSKPKIAHIKDIIVDFFYVLMNLRRIRKAREIITIGPPAISIALLLKLGLLPSCRRVYWFGLFIHHPRWIRFSHYIFRILDSRRIRYVLFSNFEKMLYAKAFSISEDKFFYVQYGDLSGQRIVPDDKVNVVKEIDVGGFYFSGGYSNRDYLSLIEIFRTLPYKLVIICASMNTEIDESAMPPNIKVLRDVPSELFDVYVKASKACIIPIAHDTGAAGQSCLLRYMMYKKIIIATDTGIICEYVANGISGILVKDNHEAMEAAIRAVDANPATYQKFADAAFERYVNYFSGKAIERRLDEMMNQSIEDNERDSLL